MALNCDQAGGTCFCVSMDTGPRATFGYDVALTEVLEDGAHWFLVEVGSERGAEVLAGCRPRRPASEERRGRRPRDRARRREPWGACMDTTGIKDLLYRNYEHPRWDDVADRCLTCANCTMVCPTCFCTTVEDVTDLDGRGRPSAASSGTRASRWTSPTSTAAACARPASRATASG